MVNNPLRRAAISRGIGGVSSPLDLHENGEAAMPRISHPTGFMKLQYRNGGLRNSWFTKWVDLIGSRFQPSLTFQDILRIDTPIPETMACCKVSPASKTP